MILSKEYEPTQKIMKYQGVQSPCRKTSWIRRARKKQKKKQKKTEGAWIKSSEQEFKLSNINIFKEKREDYWYRKQDLAVIRKR